jgi:hypothetical protein
MNIAEECFDSFTGSHDVVSVTETLKNKCLSLLMLNVMNEKVRWALGGLPDRNKETPLPVLPARISLPL